MTPVHTEILTGSDQIRELSPSVESVPSYLAFNKKKDYSRIITAFNKAMEEMKKDKTLDIITEQYTK
jgi:polar amino acid transport system substrate-binding protein